MEKPLLFIGWIEESDRLLLNVFLLDLIKDDK